MSKYIGIDNGHGKNTSGKRSPDGSLREWNFNHDVAKRLERKLKYNGFRTLMVSDTEKDTSLEDRVLKANKSGVDAFVSIHANANTGTSWSSANGIETYAYKSGGNADKLAKITQDELIKATGRRNRGVKYSNFYVLRNTKMTAILTECGFMDNKEECELLKSDSYREKCATAMAKALCMYYGITYKEEDSSNNTEKYNIGTYQKNVKITADILNVRSGRGASFPKIGAFSENKIVNVWYIDKASDGSLWGSCSCNGKTGYIHMGYTQPV